MRADMQYLHETNPKDVARTACVDYVLDLAAGYTRRVLFADH
jgi:hypothetical protein